MKNARAEAAGPPGGGRRWFDKDRGSDPGRLPRLTEALAGVAKAWTRSLNAMSAAGGEIVLRSLAPATVGELARDWGAGRVSATLYAGAWDAVVVLRFDQRFVAAVLEAMFGGVGDEDSEAQPGPGPLSSIEHSIADVIGTQVAEALTAGFSQLLPATFVYERIQAKTDLSGLGKSQAGVLVARFGVMVIGRTVDLDILIPQAASEMIGAHLGRASDANPAEADPRWSEQLEAEVSLASVKVQASIDLDAMSLGAVTRLQVGQLLALPDGAMNNVRLTCEQGELFRCDLGQSTGLFTVKVDGPAVRDALSPRKAP